MLEAPCWEAPWWKAPWWKAEERGGRARCSRRAAAHCPGRVIGSKRSHSVSPVSPSRARISSTWVVLSSAEWLRGLPAIGRPQPLTV